jgi:succinate-semialdehyde dehydrogenase/glutarate-semialdehyde dehydrogenase
MRGQKLFRSINPADGRLIEEVEGWDEVRLEQALARAAQAAPQWAALSLETRCKNLQAVAAALRDQRDALAELITREMGKLIKESRAEIDKCSWVCEYYAEKAADFLADEPIETDAGKSFVAYQPLGPVLAVMPWNFPFWQVFRFAAPALAAGNVGLLKHASNVTGCAMAIENTFREAGLPEGVFTTLLISAEQVSQVIDDSRVRAVTLTGSEPAGRAVATAAGRQLKKTVLELGGSDPFIVLEDANLDECVEKAIASRFLNSGQSCIAAKRFIVVETIADDFVARFKRGVEALTSGDPLDEATTLAPMARADLRAELDSQVKATLAQGAVAMTGCEPENRAGVFYRPSILDRVTPGMKAYRDELFGPVATVIRAADEEHAVQIANDSDFGLGGSVWTADLKRGEHVARRLECGCAFVNELVKSDPRVPFGGIKHSGYGRELSRHGIQEFVNAKTVWIR